MKTPFRKVKMAIVPVGTEKNDEASLTIAKALAREVILVGIVAIEKGESVSAGAQTARAVRKRLMKLGETPNVHFKSTIIVSETPWRDMEEVITREKPELIVVDWGNDRLTCGLPLPDVLSNSLVDVIVVRGSAALKFQKTLVAVRGGPHAELALKTAITLKPEHLDVLHISLTGADNDAPFKGYKKVLAQIPEINPRSIVTDDVSRTLFEEAENTIWSSSAPQPVVPLVGPQSVRWLPICCTIRKLRYWSPEIARKRNKRCMTRVPVHRRFRSWWTSGSQKTPITATNLPIWNGCWNSNRHQS
jgi:hypothetical protein